MDKHALWKWLILAGLVAFSLWVVTPPKEKIQLGLDLKGGTSFVVKIDEKQAEQDIRDRAPNLSDEDVARELANVMRDAQSRALEVIRNRVDSLGISEPIIYPGKDNRIIIQLPGIDEKKRDEAEKSIQSLAFLEFRMVHPNNAALVSKLFEKGVAPEGFLPSSSGGNYYVRDKSFPAERMDQAYHARLGRFHVPSAGYEFMLMKDDKDGRTIYHPLFVKRRPELTGEYLKNASVDYRSLGQPVVNIQFDSRGARKFAMVTSDYAPGGARNPGDKFRRLAIVLDGTVYSAPVIREAIYGGKAEISGNFSLPEATFLANILRAGSLPAPVKVVEKRFVAPSLGEDSIKSGVRAVIYGGVAVLLFMLVYYRFSGLIADIALILNMIILPLGMIVTAGFLGIFAHQSGGGGPIKLPVLTLPGIAGILLTIGMAVDANVLIFERIREEFSVGKRIWTSIQAGYNRAFVTIVDANLTTLLTGVILFIFGSGPIRGFAITLSAGIIVSMFTALVVTKLFFGMAASKNNEKILSMMRLVKNTSVDFVGKRRLAATLSISVIVISWILMVVKGVDNPGKVFGVDFTGGTSITFTFQQRQPVDAIRKALDGVGLRDAYIQYQQNIKGGDAFLQIKAGTTDTGEEAAKLIEKTLHDTFPQAGFKSAQVDNVGPQIGTELKKRAVWSIAMALLGIIIYISWRFEFGFALGAIIALIHDVLITVGLYCLFGRQLSLPIVAALLTIVGYSVNDTIVVFDRIREDLKLVRNKNFKEICNLSINQTLSRTLLTSLTTLITIVMLLLFGGGAINDFALALCIGVIVGTYSSIFVATPIVLLWHHDKKPELKLQPAKK